MIDAEGWVALKVFTQNNRFHYRIFCTSRGGVSGDVCFMTEAIDFNDISFLEDSLKCVDTDKRSYLLTQNGENGWTLWSKAELNRLVRNMEDKGMRVEQIEDFFQHIRSETSVIGKI